MPEIVARATAVRATYDWFEWNSGWAPPDPDTLSDWLADGVCRCPDDCLVTPEGWCEHGLASWHLILRDIDGRHDPGRHDPGRHDTGPQTQRH